jgi:O-antigen ligase
VVAALLVVVRPSVGRGSHRRLDALLALGLVFAAGQLVPLPAGVHDTLTPNGTAVRRAVALAVQAEPSGAPTSIDPESTAWALALGAAYIALFWCAREIFAFGGVRKTIRGISVIGLGLTVLVAVQRTTSPKLLYWKWQPLSAGAAPYGPFVNRNALAAWLAMAIPLAIGYVIARRQSDPDRGHGLAAAVAAIDSTTLLLAGSACLMMVGLLGSLSRSGIFAAGIGLTMFVVLSQARVTSGRAAAGIAASIAALVAIASMYANLGALAVRMQETTELGEWGRRVIWRDTAAMIRDFPLTGVGAGAFKRGMLVYQEGSRQFFFNHAHNEYLQLVAEGGLLLAAPAALAIVAGVAAIAARLRADRTAVFWIRIGAVAGLIAVAVQSIFDTSLRTPADGVLFAVVAAIALHERDDARQKPQRHAKTRNGRRGDSPSRTAVVSGVSRTVIGR